MSIFFSFFLLAAASAYILRTEKHIRRSALLLALIGGGSLLFVSIEALFGQSLVSVSGWLRADAYTWFMVALIAFTYITATIVSLHYITEEFHEKILSLDKVRMYYFSLPLFALSMIIAVLANHLGVLWIGLEGTTLSTTLLVALYRKDASIEAAWKFIILCSIGIGIGMIGILMFVHAGVAAGLNVFDAFSYTALRANAHLLSDSTIKLAFVFILVGLGTKVGFVPMHTWLPDAHSKTPSPISALLSGVLLNVAFYALLRFKMLVDLRIGSSAWTDHLLIGFGVLSVVAAAFFLLQQRNYKRMLAYSSVEHMGLMSFAAGLGPIGVLALTIHTFFHTLTKSALFYISGEVLLTQKTTKIAGIQQLMRYTPIAASLLLFGVLMIIAVPPSGLFTSEFLFLAAGLQTMPILTLLILVSLSLIAFSMMKNTLTMLYQTGEEVVEEHMVHHKETWNLTHGVVLLQLLLVVIFGLLITTAPVLNFFVQISKTI